MSGTTVVVRPLWRFAISPDIEPVVSIRKNTSSAGIFVENASGLFCAPAGSWYGRMKKKSCDGPLWRNATTVICACPISPPRLAVTSETCAPDAAKPGMSRVFPIIEPTAWFITSHETCAVRSSVVPSA